MTSQQLDLLLEYIQRSVMLSKLTTKEGMYIYSERMRQLVKELEDTTEE